ncbi:LacI family DNA-binding transcriptional regulator [Microcella alkalica]|uniref:LacI family transcriptional regulator n=1 Tax=Microcella alkalica TaxID=355930 RepID=A0A839ECF5_9MICO|nr:LacI family transcriptional regulator [Microcella alkalica]
MVTSHDVARLAGVSQATVSRALTSSSKIRPATKARVLAAMQELNYVPHAGAQTLRTRRSGVVGVVVSDLANPFYAQMLDELTRVLSLAGYRAVVWNAGGGSHADALQAIGENAVDGVIFTTATASSPELLEAVDRNRPLVLINRDVEGVACDRVIGDNAAGGRAVADFLCERGRTEIALISGPAEATTSRDRTESFLARMRERGHDVPEHFRFDGAFSHDAAAQITRRVMTREVRPDGIFCANDNMAFGALDTLREFDLHADDCYVIGYDDVDMASWASFSLTTVRQPIREMAATGGRLLIERINDPERPPQTVTYAPVMIERGSTAGAISRRGSFPRARG